MNAWDALERPYYGVNPTWDLSDIRPGQVIKYTSQPIPHIVT